MMQLVVKIALSIFLLLCLLHMPYGYFQVVRFLGMVGFAILAYFSYEQKRNVEVIIYVSLALLFQPFIKVAFGRTIWNIVDIIVAIGLIVSIIYRYQRQRKRE
jgi:hypothetical protein